MSTYCVLLPPVNLHAIAPTDWSLILNFYLAISSCTVLVELWAPRKLILAYASVLFNLGDIQVKSGSRYPGHWVNNSDPVTILDWLFNLCLWIYGSYTSQITLTDIYVVTCIVMCKYGTGQMQRCTCEHACNFVRSKTFQKVWHSVWSWVFILDQSDEDLQLKQVPCTFLVNF